MSNSVDHAVRIRLKSLKTSFDKPTLHTESGLRIGVFLANDPTVHKWRGEILHQLALRRVLDGDITTARKYFDLSISHLELHGTPLAQARVLRDSALLAASILDFDRARHEIARALELHADDIENKKGSRQRLITETYGWRIAHLAGENRQKHLSLMTWTALNRCRDWCPRDRRELVTFVLERLDSRSDRASLMLINVQIDARRGDIGCAVKSSMAYLLNAQLTVAERFGLKFRRE